MLYLVATPIGNLEDITLRALRVLREVDFILAEDTRKTGRLLKRFGIKKKLISFYEHNERRKIPWVIAEIKKGKNIALVSNAGTPTLSDPGYKLVRECRKESLPLTSLPGPSSITNALALSSQPHEKFVFLGYIPRKENQRQKLLMKVKNWEATLVFFESPFRVIGSLEDLMAALGNRSITVAREMTKKFETVYEGNIEGALKHFRQNKPRGEFTLILDNRSL
jgi:16S rRNA (cytidine1402-2'-O)-methyltransferase